MTTIVGLLYLIPVAMSSPLSQRLKPGADLWLGTGVPYRDQLAVWMDAVELEREQAIQEEAIDYLRGVPFNEVFETEHEARLAWYLLQVYWTGSRHASDHSDFPNAVKEKRVARRQREHIKSYQQRRALTPKGIADRYGGEV